MYCKYCGKEIPNESKYCSYCGSNLYLNIENTKIDNASIGWFILGFLVPLVGLILFLLWEEEKPLTAKKVGLGALVSAIIQIILVILVIIGFVCFIYKNNEIVLMY